MSQRFRLSLDTQAGQRCSDKHAQLNHCQSEATFQRPFPRLTKKQQLIEPQSDVIIKPSKQEPKQSKVLIKMMKPLKFEAKSSKKLELPKVDASSANISTVATELDFKTPAAYFTSRNLRSEEEKRVLKEYERT